MMLPCTFRESLSSVGWHLLWSALTPTLKSLCSPTTKIWKAMQNVKIPVVWWVRGYPRSPAMSPYDRSHNFLFDFIRNYVSIFYRFCIRASCQKSPILTYPTCIWHPRWGTSFKFCGDLWHKKTIVPASVRCLRDPMFSCFYTILMCDGWTDRRTDIQQWLIMHKHSVAW